MSHTIGRLALKSGGIGESEVKYLHHPGLPEAFISLDRGLVDASFGSPPRPGFRELVDLSSLKLPFLQGAIEVQRSFLQKRRDTALNLLRAYVENIKLAKERPELIIASIAKRMRVSADVVRSAYQPHAMFSKKFPMCENIRCKPLWIFIPKTNCAMYRSKSSSTTACCSSSKTADLSKRYIARIDFSSEAIRPGAAY